MTGAKKFIGNHVEDIDGGRTVGVGEIIESPGDGPKVQQLVDDGLLIDVDSHDVPEAAHTDEITTEDEEAGT